MKKIMLMLSICFALNVNSTITEINTYQIPVDQKERIVLENEIGKSDFINPERIDQLVNCKVIKVTYVYSAYAPDGFDQKKLDEARKTNLHQLIDLNNPKIVWNEVSQTACRRSSCAKELLHGFVIEYVPKNAFHYGRIEKQNYTVDAQKGRKITGKCGTQVRIKPNSFTYADGSPVQGEVHVELREALSFEDIVKGNLQTITDKGELLQTGGMIQVQAYSNGKNLKIKESKSIDVMVPNKNKVEGMKYFSGKEENGIIEWTDPIELGIAVEEETDLSVAAEEVELVAEGADVSVNNIIWWKGIGRSVNYGVKNKSKNIISAYYLDFRGNKISDFSITINGKKSTFSTDDYTYDMGVKAGLEEGQAKKIREWFDQDKVVDLETIDAILLPSNVPFALATVDFGDLADLPTKPRRIRRAQGVNLGQLDPSLGYVLSMKKLGWANIDRFALFKKTYMGNLEIEVKNIPDSCLASIALVVPSANIFISGYKMKSGNYAFTHGDFENKVSLPLNEPAVVVATYEEDGNNYFGSRKIKIGTKDKESLPMLKRDKKAALKEIEFLF